MTKGQRIKMLRERLEMTQPQLASKIGSTKQTIYKYESGKVTNIPSDKFEAIAVALGTTPSALMGWENDEQAIESNASKSILPPVDRSRRERYIGLDAYGKRASDVLYDALDKLMAVESQRIKDAEQGALDEGFAEKLIEWPVPLYDIAVSAGTGQFLDSEHYEVVWLKKEPPRGTTFMVKVNGDSMEPQIHNGDRIFVQQQPQVRETEIGVFYLDGDVYVKEFWGSHLSSINPNYGDIELDKFETVRCYGRVLGVCKE